MLPGPEVLKDVVGQGEKMRRWHHQEAHVLGCSTHGSNYRSNPWNDGFYGDTQNSYQVGSESRWKNQQWAVSPTHQYHPLIVPCRYVK